MKLRITREDVSYEVEVEVLEGDAPGAVVSAPSPVSQPAPAAAPVARPSTPQPSAGSDDKVCKSPIAGTIISLKVKPGDKVAVNQTLMIMEAMKMETNIASPVAGVVKTIHVKPGDAVKQGQLLVDFN